MLDPFLANLPAPTVVDALSVESILNTTEVDLIARFPAIAPVLSLESSATKKILEAVSYREMLLRARANDASRANLLAFASGADLDHVGAGSYPPVARMTGETDDRFRSRILLAAASRNVGSVYRYQYEALTADLNIKSAIAYRIGRSPIVYLALLSNSSDGVATASQIAAVKAILDRPENRLVNGAVVVRSAVTTVTNVVAAITVTPGTPSTITTAAEAALRAAWTAEGGLGRDLTLEWIKARLMIPGVYSVALTSPVSTIIKPPYEAASIGTAVITIAGENI